jgi:hypothetical protein
MSYLIKTPYLTEYGINTPYIHADSKELHDINKKRLGPYWKWYNNDNFTYNFNSYGYRMDKELDDVNFDNYIAFFGCSYTVGVGLPLKETYAYRVASELGVDYVNAALGGGSPMFVYNNFIKMFTTAPKRPKAVIINWPDIYRTMYWFDNDLQFKGPNFPANSQGDYWRDSYKAFISEKSNIENVFSLYRDTIRLVCELSNCKIFEFSTHQPTGDFFERYPEINNIPLCDENLVIPNSNLTLYNVKFARDMMKGMIAHPGLQHQQYVTERLLKELQL